VFFDGARTPIENVVGDVNGGWKVAMGTLAFERGASTLGQQLSFENELTEILDVVHKRGPGTTRSCANGWPTPGSGCASCASTRCAPSPRSNGRDDPVDQCPQAVLGERCTAGSGSSPWRSSGWTRRSPTRCPTSCPRSSGSSLYSRADTIYGGSNQIQRNVIGERALGLPKEPR